jgi:hypothetical protein
MSCAINQYDQLGLWDKRGGLLLVDDEFSKITLHFGMQLIISRVS